MRKSCGTATREHVRAAHSAFAAAQKVRPADTTDVLASKAPKSHKEMMTDHGLDPQTATSDAFIKICECAETKDALKHPSRSRRFKSDDCSSMEHPNKKAKKKATAGHHELNLLQQERKKEQAKWTKGCKRLQSKAIKENDKAGKVRKKTASTFTPREHQCNKSESKDSSSSSSASSSRRKPRTVCRNRHVRKTTAKINRLKFSLPELQANRNIEKSFHQDF
jgi:hypothetical protein